MNPKAKFPKPEKWKCWRCEDQRASMVRNSASEHDLKKFDEFQRSFRTKAQRDNHEFIFHKTEPGKEQQRNTVKRRIALALARIKAELQRGADAHGAGTII